MTIQTIRGPLEIRPHGHVGPFAIHYRVTVGASETTVLDPYEWTVTHRRTGLRASPDGVYLCSYERARAYAQALVESGADWEFQSVDAIPERTKDAAREVLERWSVAQIAGKALNA